MAASIINFPPEQAQLLELGRIPAAIRPCYPRKRNPEPGDTLHLYAGRLIRTEVCEAVNDIVILPPIGDVQQIIVAGRMLEESAVFELAADCGFRDDECLVGHVAKQWGLPFNGNLIGWRFGSFQTVH